jgi:hypothetical protein
MNPYDYEGDLDPELFEDLGGDAGELEQSGDFLEEGQDWISEDGADLASELDPELFEDSSATGSGSQVPDGKTPLPGTTEKRRSHTTNPPYQSQPGQRDVKTYNYVLDQFAVGVNPRYAHAKGATWCNIYLWDVTRAMGAEIPHWVDKSGNPVAVGQGNELSANATNAWLHKYGSRFGWQKVTLDQAVTAANMGCPAVVSWKNPGGHGHVAMIRPSQPTSQGPWMAQAGRINSSWVRMYRGGSQKGIFGKGAALTFFIHD